jgi:DNA-binding response OmpR family regulator
VPTLLLIDDDNQLRPFYRLALERAGYRVVEAADGLDGVRAYRQSPTDVVVLDVFMPGLGGLDALCRLRRLDPAARVVVMSAGGEAPLAEALALGAATALHKPFGLSELLEAVKRALAG